MPTHEHTLPTIRQEQYIGGAWVQSAGDATVDIVDPSTEEVIAAVPRATPDEATAAIATARRAYDHGPWRWMTPRERGQALARFAEALDNRRDDLVSIAVRQLGALVGLAQGLQVGFAIDAAHRYADLAAHHDALEKSSFEGLPFDTTRQNHKVRVVQRVPAGVVSAITPFNYPLMMNVQKVFPALAVGCSVVLKPTPTTCLDAAVMAEAADDAGLPEGVLSILLGGEADVGEVMASDPRVDVVTFTGSTATGRRIMELAAPTVKKTVLELGGKSPNIVFADADLDAFFLTDPGNLRHCGQGCGQLTRLLVEDAIHDEVVERLRDRLETMVVGPPDDPTTELGPLVNQRQYDRVLGYIQAGQEEGARLVCGGGRPDHLPRGYYVQPTLFADVDNSMRIAQEEIFGPVPVVIRFSGEDEAIRIANDSIYGINGSVWTSDLQKAWRVASRVLTGNMGINCLANVMEGPHGGFKQTGIGREWWEWSMQEYLELRAFSYEVG
jgi:aldehyde dehydrogenase (NAD+)